MKNLLKKYFLFLSDGPFSISVIFFIVSLLLILAISILSTSNSALNTIIISYWWISIIFSIVNMILGYYIKENCITFYDIENNPSGGLFAILVTKEGERKVFNKSVWGKNKVYWITSNACKDLWWRKNDEDGEMKAFCFINGKYKNSLVKIPVNLTLEYKNPIDKLGLFDLLVKNLPESERLSLDDYLRNIFNKVNERNKPKFDEIISRYAQLMISDAQFLSEILDVVEFPERIFPYIVDTKLCLGEPETSACKGMMCGK